MALVDIREKPTLSQATLLSSIYEGKYEAKHEGSFRDTKSPIPVCISPLTVQITEGCNER